MGKLPFYLLLGRKGGRGGRKARLVSRGKKGVELGKGRGERHTKLPQRKPRQEEEEEEEEKGIAATCTRKYTWEGGGTWVRCVVVIRL